MAKGAKDSATVDLLAVILVARLQPGPRLIFHYPPHLQLPPVQTVKRSDDTESDSDLETPANHKDGHATSSDRQINRDHSTFLSVGGLKGRETSSDTLFGYPEEALQKLLSPGCWSDRKRFETSLNGLTFVGHPIWAAQDGSWARKHSHEDEKSKQQSTPRANPQAESRGDESPTPLRNGVAKPATSNSAPDFSHAPESVDSRAAGHSFATSMASESSLSGLNAAEKLTMFNVVFVVGSERSADHSRQVTAVYQHVTRTMSKALHYCQRQSQYLGLQSKNLINAKAKARQDGLSEVAVCEAMIESSELAWALKETLAKIQHGEIAGVRINGMEMALQIPARAAKEINTDRDLEPHSGLLLLESKETLLRESSHPDASTLAYFIREHTPTKSLQKLATRMGIALDEMLNLAQHLVKWRKARTITPLHPRNTYILCHDAPLGRVKSYYAEDYAKKFPVLPSLSQMLRFLSGKPVRYGILIPSRDHRNPYMQILAYLVQHHIVEQLKTYGWLQAPTTPATRARRVEEVNENRRPLSVASLLSPQMRPVRDDDAISVSSERTAIPVSVLDSVHRRLDPASVPGSYGAQQNGDNEPAQIVKTPMAPSAEDEQRIQHIRDTVEDEELRDRFPHLLRYFDGMYPFEEIAAGEGVKRAKVEAWLDALQKHGFLVTFRAT